MLDCSNDKQRNVDDFFNDVHNTQLKHHSLASYEERLLKHVKQQIQTRKSLDAIVFHIPRTFESKTVTLDQQQRLFKLIAKMFENKATLYSIRYWSPVFYTYNAVSADTKFKDFYNYIGIKFNDCKSETFKDSTSGTVERRIIEALLK